ncbi:MAG: hypothetical protein HUU14_08165 [Dehalococcoidia bacterium]|nr:hypothetical protein [Chloroflexi bacterium CFX7]MCK6563236.1 hypothetical protein [Dehalococcoidia bacterium]NUQ55846.1 hypothetical protein [Dehalococcoidia bacterium]RIL02406.1 MAG: hypothetical protein DCC78_06975 [bacterium]
MAYNPEDLDPLEVTLLGVLSLGLPPSRAAGDDTFRVDHVTAVTHALQLGATREMFLAPGAAAVTPGFRARLREAVRSLGAKEVLAEQAPGLPAPPGGYEEGLLIDTVDPDVHPVVLDHYLGQACMESLLRNPIVYPYLMERYASSGEVWRRLRAGGYAE